MEATRSRQSGIDFKATAGTSSLSAPAEAEEHDIRRKPLRNKPMRFNATDLSETSKIIRETEAADSGSHPGSQAGQQAPTRLATFLRNCRAGIPPPKNAKNAGLREHAAARRRELYKLGKEGAHPSLDSVSIIRTASFKASASSIS